MLKKLLKIFSSILLVLLAVSLHLAAVFVLPFPYSTVNMLIVATSLFVLFQQQGSVVWFSFFAFFAVELYSAQPFGIQLLSGTLQALFVYWLGLYLFTNRSWLAAIALSAAGLLIYRSIYTICLVGFHLLINRLSMPPAGTIFSLYVTELIMTSLGAALIFFVLKLFVKKKHSTTRAQYV